MVFIKRIFLFFIRLLRDPFFWCGVAYLFGLPQLAAALPVDVLTQYPVLQGFCVGISEWMPWISKTAATYIKFPEVALLLLTLMWVSLPVQIILLIWLSSMSPLLRSEIIPYARKYPIRFPIGVFIVIVLMIMTTIWQIDAKDVARLTGWRPSGFLSHMPESQAWFGFGLAFHFFGISFFICTFAKSTWLIVFNKLPKES